MATCKDCIHEKVCVWNAELEEACNEDCSDFKNKADYAKVKHGQWLHKNGEMICSVCGGEALMDEVYYESPYCPDCGAILDGGKSDE